MDLQNSNARYLDKFDGSRTNVKINAPPGGKSNFSLGWENPEPKQYHGKSDPNRSYVPKQESHNHNVNNNMNNNQMNNDSITNTGGRKKITTKYQDTDIFGGSSSGNQVF